ncbi:MAG: CBS domain-containing protein [Allosphingosinicella sp.]|uniref:CBS domain-containing protein n=1 Tax=Allosphingosinicella sp. TaxID=2823234 RepID=UPI00392A9423
MKIADVMTAEVDVVKPDQTIQQAASFMLRADAGSIPVCDGERLVGMVTDRDIAVRAVAEGMGPDTPVRETMSDEVLYCFEDEDVETVAAKMSESQVRRMPVVSREDKRLVGIVSLGDISRSNEHDIAALALDGITDPGGEHSQV